MIADGTRQRGPAYLDRVAPGEASARRQGVCRQVLVRPRAGIRTSPSGGSPPRKRARRPSGGAMTRLAYR
jgi:hypothetical protein